MSKLLKTAVDPGGTRPEENQLNPPRRILVVEDDPDLSWINARALIRSGYKVDMAENGAAAWEAIQANCYDLMIADNDMPRLTGIGLLKKLRSTGIDLPVILAMGTLPNLEFAKNPRLAPVALLEKPYATDKLLGAVMGALQAVSPKINQPREELPSADAGAFSVERYTARRKLEWDTFVNAARNATFLFARDYMDYHSDRFADHSMMIFDGRKLVAVLPANLNANGTLISHEGLTFGGLVISRSAMLGDVLACFHAVLQYLNQRQISKLVYKRIPAFYHTLPDDEIAYALFLIDARLYRRDCAATISQADRLPFRRNHQRLIRKAASHRVRIVREKSFRSFWERVLTPQLAARYGVKPVHTLKEITLLASRFPEQIKQFSAYCGNEIVAGTTIYETPTVAHAQYGSVTEKGRQIGAEVYLFEFFDRAIQGQAFFHFGISNEKEGRVLNHGLYGWKEGFGARCYAHDFYEIATGNHPKLESVIRARPGKASEQPETI